MAVPVTMPQMGESVIEGTVSRWLKAVGDRVAKLEPLVEIATDKIDTEVPSPAGGTLLAVHVAEGVTVAAGTVLAYIGEEGEVVPASADESRAAVETVPIAQDPSQAAPDAAPAAGTFVSPVVARMVAEHQLDLADISGTGLGGRVTKKDVETYLAQTARPAEPDVVQPLTNMRRAIAEHMVRSKRTSPHVTTFFEVDMLAVVQHRELAKTSLQQKGIALTFTPYFVAATASALRSVPEVNARFSDAGIVMQPRVHIGIAVSVKQGLLVPVIRDADEKNLQGLARGVGELAHQARTGELHPEQLQGGTFTITNHGTGGSLAGTPIINQPQAAILGVGAIVKRPVVVGGDRSPLPNPQDTIAIRPMCLLSLTFDHRILDGARADEFLTLLKKSLESWENYEPSQL